MTNDKTLLAVWKENLTTELKQSLLWNAIPYDEMNRVDFTDLQPNEQQFVSTWVFELLEKSAARTKISPVPSLAKKLKHIYYENLIHQREYGKSIIGFGYPLFIQKDKDEPNKNSAAPLFIWELELKPDREEPGDWILERKMEAPITANPFLMHYFKSEYDLDLTELVKDALANFHVSQLELMKICNEIAIKLGFEGTISTTNATAIPREDELSEILEEAGAIHYSGVFGLYEPKNAASLDVLSASLARPTLPSSEISSAASLAFRHNDYSAIATNPYQAAIIRALESHDKIAVTGGHGTGKSHTIAALASNLLANKKRTLVIANKVNGLKSIQRELDKIGLGELTFVLTDPYLQKGELVEAIYQNSLGAKKLPQFEEEDFQHQLNRTNRLRNRLDKVHESISEPIFDHANWTEMVGAFIKNQQIEGKHLLNSHLQVGDYQFTKAEYDDYTAKIERAELLYNELNTMKHPLRVLNQNISTDRNHEDAKSFTFDTLDKILNEVGEVYNKFVVELENYGDEMNGQFETYYQNLKSKIAEVRADIKDYKNQYGDDFNKSGAFRNMRMRMFSAFSKRLGNILELKQEVKAGYNDVQGAFEYQRYFAYSFPKIKSSTSFEKLGEHLDEFEQSLEDWKASTPNIIQQEIDRLDLENINPNVNFKSNIEALNKDFEDLLERVNGYELYQKKFHSNADTLLNKRGYLEEMTETLETLQYNLRDFDAYYFWTNYWLSLNDAQKAVIKSLIVTKPKNWLAAFNSWYFYNLLNKHYGAHLLTDKKTLDEYADQQQKLKDFLPKKALKHWKLNQVNIPRRIRRESKFLYNVFFGKSRSSFLFEFNVKVLFDSEFETLTTMFPVLMTTPNVASEWLPALENYFDVVVVDDAETVQTEDVVGALWRSRKQVILGDELTIGKTLAPSLLTMARQSDYQLFELPLYHNMVDEKIWTFKNASFYNNTIKILPSQKTKAQQSMRLLPIEGVYIPNQNVNEEEAQQILHLLNEIEPNKNGRFPKVGIVCLTRDQRNLLTHYIEQIKARKIAGNERILNLEQSGLGVHYYRDLQNHSFDVMMVATTFGMDVRNEFTDDILELNELEGLQGLNALLSAASQQVIFVSSIPQTYMEHYAQYNRKAKGVHILANLLMYAEAVESKDENTQNRILKRLADLHRKSNIQPKEKEHSVFVNELAAALSPYLEHGRMQAHQHLDGLDLDILIAPIHPGQPVMALQADASFWRTPQGNYAWEREIEAQLQPYNIRYMPVWSLEFWKSPEIAVKQLAGQLIKFDNHFLPKPPMVATPTDVVAADDSDESGNNASDDVEAAVE